MRLPTSYFYLIIPSLLPLLPLFNCNVETSIVHCCICFHISGFVNAFNNVKTAADQQVVISSLKSCLTAFLNVLFKSNDGFYPHFIRFPLYYHMKFAFLVWLQLPASNVSMAKLQLVSSASLHFLSDSIVGFSLRKLPLFTFLMNSMFFLIRYQLFFQFFFQKEKQFQKVKAKFIAYVQLFLSCEG